MRKSKFILFVLFCLTLQSCEVLLAVLEVSAAVASGVAEASNSNSTTTTNTRTYTPTTSPTSSSSTKSSSSDPLCKYLKPSLAKVSLDQKFSSWYDFYMYDITATNLSQDYITVHISIYDHVIINSAGDREVDGVHTITLAPGQTKKLTNQPYVCQCVSQKKKGCALKTGQMKYNVTTKCHDCGCWPK